MDTISKEEVLNRLQFENPWWNTATIDKFYQAMKPRPYLRGFQHLVSQQDVSRAVVLMGPRRVGKTVLIYHAIQKLIEAGIPAKKICYVSLEAPIYIDLTLEKIVNHFKEKHAHGDLKGCFFFFDEIQYLKNWELHLKKLVDDFRETKFCVSGSAAAALKLKSIESGAGRFTNFNLPPLTFYEYMFLLNKEFNSDLFFSGKSELPIEKVNEQFVNYLNFGGYPEALFSEAIRRDPYRFIRSDIIDKVLLRDLPSVYGIQDIQELNRLFSMLAYNSGNEVSLDGLSKNSGVAKNTIKRYLEYLEAAFLIVKFDRIDQSGKTFKRAHFFKVYLTNPSMRCALFGPVGHNHAFMGNMTETAIISQFATSETKPLCYYARWPNGEVDLVLLSNHKVVNCAEIKWSDRYIERPEELKQSVEFCKKHKLNTEIVTTITQMGVKTYNGVKISFMPASLYAYVMSQYFVTEAIHSITQFSLKDAAMAKLKELKKQEEK